MFFRLISLLAVTLTLFATSAQASKRIALLIGNQDYQPGVGLLVNPLNDIQLVGNALRKVGFNVLKPVKNATRADILDALDAYTERLRKAGSGAIGFVYYSGHGIASKGVNYLIPIDIARPSTRLLRASGVKQSEVLAILRQEAPVAAHYVVIDACRNELQGARGAKGFVAVHQQAGTLIAFATSPGRTASDQGNGSGPYAKALAAELVKPGITDLQMFSNVRYAVAQSTGGDQVPWTLDGIIRRDRVMFGGTPTAARRPPNRPSSVAREWEKLKAEQDEVILLAFAERYKGTPYAESAMSRIKLLRLQNSTSQTSTRAEQSQNKQAKINHRQLTEWRPGTSGGITGDLIKHMIPAVVSIRVMDSAGARKEAAGFLISPNGLIATHSDVVANAEKIEISSSNGSKKLGKIVGVDRATGVALLKVNAEDRPVPYIKFANRAPARLEPVAAFSKAARFVDSARIGHVSLLTTIDTGPEQIEVPGMSKKVLLGSPLIDGWGEVVGIISGYLAPGKTRKFRASLALPSPVAKEVIDQLRRYGRVVNRSKITEVIRKTASMSASRR